MPKKKSPETPEEQSARFVRDAERLVAAGDLSLDEAAAKLEKLVRRSRSS